MEKSTFIILLGIIFLCLSVAMTLDLYTDAYPDSNFARWAHGDSQ